LENGDKEKFFDMEEWNCTSVFIKGVDIIVAENTVCSMQMKEKNDVYFIFDDNIPQLLIIQRVCTAFREDISQCFTEMVGYKCQKKVSCQHKL